MGWILVTLAACAVLVPIVLLTAESAPLVLALVVAVPLVWALLRRIGRATPASLSAPPALAVVLLPTAIALEVQSPEASRVAVVLLVAALLWQVRGRIAVTGPLLLLVAAAGVIASRAGIFGLLNVVLFSVAAFAVAGLRDRAVIVRSVLDGVGVLLLVNVMLWAVGITSPAAATRSDAGDGLLGTRVMFPLFNSVNAAPVFAAAFLVGVCCLLGQRLSKRVSVLRVLSAAAALFVIVAADARAAAAVAIVLVVLLALSTRLLTLAAPVVAVLALALPLAYTAIRPAVQGVLAFASEALPFLASRRGEDNASLSGRDFIWESSIDQFTILTTDQQAFGFGPGGHIASGASARYQSLFGYFQGEALFLSPHSSALQIIFDGGIVSLVLFFAGLIWTLVRLGRARDGAGLVGAAFATAVLIGSATETLILPGSVSLAFVLLAILAASPRAHSVRRDAPADTPRGRRRPALAARLP